MLSPNNLSHCRIVTGRFLALSSSLPRSLAGGLRRAPSIPIPIFGGESPQAQRQRLRPGGVYQEADRLFSTSLRIVFFGPVAFLSGWTNGGARVPWVRHLRFVTALPFWLGTSVLSPHLPAVHARSPTAKKVDAKIHRHCPPLPGVLPCANLPPTSGARRPAIVEDHPQRAKVPVDSCVPQPTHTSFLPTSSARRPGVKDVCLF